VARFLGAILALAAICIPGGTSAADPIKDMAVQSLGRSGPQPIPGWEFHSVDLNSGVGGDYIYAGWQRGTDNPVTQVDFEAFGEAQGVNPRADWEWSPVDLNGGAGGRWIYMFWKRGGASPVYNIAFIVTDSSTPFAIPGYTAINVDLNAGSGGPYIWGYYTADPNNSTFTGGGRGKTIELRAGNTLRNLDRKDARDKKDKK
jgi:hypothetical protein